MRILSQIILGLVLLALIGCGGPTVTSPTDDELSNYVSENPSEFSSDAELDSGDTAE